MEHKVVHRFTKAAAGLMTAVLMLTACTENPEPEQSEPVSREPAGSTVSIGDESSQSDGGEADVPLTAREIIAAHMEKNLEYKPLVDPDGEYNLQMVKNIRMVGMVTGEDSINQTRTKYDIGGTDLGILWNVGEKTYIAFGDTFANEGMHGNWRSNVLAYTTDTDYTDGILFDGMVTSKDWMAKELIRSRKKDNVEMTTIPTGAIYLNGAHYLSFMSVRHWGEPGEWDCNYGAVAKSTDDGENWEVLDNLKWPGESNFCQMLPVEHEGYVYVYGITGGRGGISQLMRVPAEQYENFDAYEYLTGLKDDGTPVFEAGEEAMNQKYALLPKAVGEMSVLYSEYLEEWIVTYISGGHIIMRTSKELWGPFSKPVYLAKQEDFPGLYGAFMNENFVSEDGKKIGFLMSLWDPVYNVAIMECELERK